MDGVRLFSRQDLRNSRGELQWQDWYEIKKPGTVVRIPGKNQDGFSIKYG
jgi:hypothetical protein